MEWMDADEFARRVQEYGDKTMHQIIKTVAAQVFLAVSQTILESTPVLTGQARRNWIPSVDEPAAGSILGPGDADETHQPLLGIEEVRLKQVVKQYLNGDSDFLYLTNNLPYIWFLDQGTSKKAPEGMVLPSISATLQALQDKAIKLDL